MLRSLSCRWVYITKLQYQWHFCSVCDDGYTVLYLVCESIQLVCVARVLNQHLSLITLLYISILSQESTCRRIVTVQSQPNVLNVNVEATWPQKITCTSAKSALSVVPVSHTHAHKVLCMHTHIHTHIIFLSQMQNTNSSFLFSPRCIFRV